MATQGHLSATILQFHALRFFLTLPEIGMQVESVQSVPVGWLGAMELLNLWDLPWDLCGQRHIFKGSECGELMPLRGEPGH